MKNYSPYSLLNKHLLFFFFSLLLLASCRKKEEEEPKEAGISAITIALNDEKFTLASPKTGATASLTNAPRSFHVAITSLMVSIASTDANAAVIKDGAAFTNGSAVDFSQPVNFTVRDQNGTTTFTIEVKPYNATSNPYGIYTATHLSDIRNAKFRNYKVMQDITLPDANEAGAKATGITDYATAGWLPIGDETYGLSGVLDGGGHKIDNFYTNRETSYVGFVGEVEGEGSIKNLGVNGATTRDFAAGGRGHMVGILVGRNFGTIENCYATGNVTALSYYAGGLVGASGGGTIYNCYATGNVTATSSSCKAGGLVGYSGYSEREVRISHCYATGNVTATAASYPYESYAGGLVGYCITKGTFSNCYATGNVTATSSPYPYESYAGGLVGYPYSDMKISNCYATGNVSSSRRAGGLMGLGGSFSNCYRNSNASITKASKAATPDDEATPNITPKTLAEMKTDDFKKLLNGTSGTAWGYSAGKNNDLPYLIGVGVGK